MPVMTTPSTADDRDSLDFLLCPCDDLFEEDYINLVIQSPPPCEDVSAWKQTHELAWIDTSPSASSSQTPANDHDCSDQPGQEPAPSTGQSKPKTPPESPSDEAIKMRRRLQNRASQKAFRERKEKHTRAISRQLDALTKKHGELQESYTQQSKVMIQLSTRIAELNAQLIMLRQNPHGGGRSSNNSGHPQYHHHHHSCDSWDSFDKFDAVMLPASPRAFGNAPSSLNGAGNMHDVPSPNMNPHMGMNDVNLNSFGSPSQLNRQAHFAAQMQNLPAFEPPLYVYGR